jgi:hypothetical protein
MPWVWADPIVLHLEGKKKWSFPPSPDEASVLHELGVSCSPAQEPFFKALSHCWQELVGLKI